MFHSDFLQHLKAGHRAEHIGNRWRTRFESARRRRKLKVLRVVGERIRLPEPSRRRRRKRWNELFANVQKSEAGRSKKIFQRSSNVEIEIHRFHVNRAGAATLVIIEHDKSAS